MYVLYTHCTIFSLVVIPRVSHHSCGKYSDTESLCILFEKFDICLHAVLLALRLYFTACNI